MSNAEEDQELMRINRRTPANSQTNRDDSTNNRRKSISSVTVQLHLNDDKQKEGESEDNEDYSMEASELDDEDYTKFGKQNYSYNKAPRDRMDSDSGASNDGLTFRYLLPSDAFGNKQSQVHYMGSPSNTIQFVSTPAPPIRQFSTPAPQSVSNQIPQYSQYLSGQSSNVQYIATPAPPQFATTSQPRNQYLPSISNYPQALASQVHYASTSAPENNNFGSHLQNLASQQQSNNNVLYYSTPAPRAQFGSTPSPSQQFLSQLSSHQQQSPQSHGAPNQVQFLSTPAPSNVFVSTPVSFLSSPSPSPQFSTGSPVFNNRLNSASEAQNSDNHMHIVHFDNSMTGVRSPQINQQSSNIFVSSTPEPSQASNDVSNRVNDNSWRSNLNNNFNQLLKLSNNNNNNKNDPQSQFQNFASQFNNQLDHNEASSVNHLLLNNPFSNQKQQQNYKGNQQKEIEKDNDHSQTMLTSDFGWKLNPKKGNLQINDAQASSLYSLASLENNNPKGSQSSPSVTEYQPYPDNPFLSHISFPTAAPTFKTNSVQSVNIQSDNNREQNVNLGYSIGFGQQNEILKADQTSYSNKFPFISLGHGFTTASNVPSGDVVKGIPISPVNGPQQNFGNLQEYASNNYKAFEKIRNINSIQDTINGNAGHTLFATTVAPFKLPPGYKPVENYNPNNNNNNFNNLNHNNNNFNNPNNNNNFNNPNNNNNFNNPNNNNNFNNPNNNYNNNNYNNNNYNNAKSVQNYQNVVDSYGNELKHDNKGTFKWNNIGSGVEVSGGGHVSTIKPILLSTPENVTPNPILYLNNDIITNSPVIFTNQNDPVNGRIVQNFDHANAMKNIQPIGLTNVLPFSASPLGDGSKGVTASPQFISNQMVFPNANLFKNYPIDQSDISQSTANLLQQSLPSFLSNYKPIDQSFLVKDKNLLYNLPTFKNQFNLADIQGSNLFLNKPREQNQFASNNNYQIKSVENVTPGSYNIFNPNDMSGHSSNIETRHVSHMEYVPSDAFRGSSHTSQKNFNSASSSQSNQGSNPELLGTSGYHTVINHPLMNVQQYDGDFFNKFNPNLGINQLEPLLAASDSRYRFMSNKNDRQNSDEIIQFEKQNDVDSQSDRKLNNLQDMRISNPFNVDLKLVSELLNNNKQSETRFESLNDQFSRRPSSEQTKTNDQSGYQLDTSNMRNQNERDLNQDFEQIELVRHSKNSNSQKKKKKYKNSDMNKFRDSFGNEELDSYHTVSSLASEQLHNNVHILTAHQIGAVIDQQPGLMARVRSQDGPSAPELDSGMFLGFDGSEFVDPKSPKLNEGNQRQNDEEDAQQQLKDDVDEPYPLLTPPKPPNGARQFRKKHERRPVIPRRQKMISNRGNRPSKPLHFHEEYDDVEPNFPLRTIRSFKRKMG